jgi:N-acyl-D-amino-acid deacylase
VRRTDDQSVSHPRGYGNNARVLSRYVREQQLISLEDAIRKMTSLPAQTFGFRDRGLLREGFAADIVIFDEKTIADQATYEKPHQYASGLSLVVVNGQIVVENDKLSNVRPGMALRGGGHPVTLARQSRAHGIIPFSYDFTARPSELNPSGDYLGRGSRNAFSGTVSN